MKTHIWKIAAFISVFLITFSINSSKVLAAESGSLDMAVCIEWDDEEDHDGLRPEKVTITLYAGGTEIGRSITLCAENDWEGVFEGLPLYIDGNLQSYSIVQDRIDGYTCSIEGSDAAGYKITNIHEPLPEGRSGEEEMGRLEEMSSASSEGQIVETVVTTKVSKSMPARTSTTIKKTMSAKTADTSETIYWGGTLLGAITALFIWMRIEQNRK